MTKEMDPASAQGHNILHHAAQFAAYVSSHSQCLRDIILHALPGGLTIMLEAKNLAGENPVQIAVQHRNRDISNIFTRLQMML